MTPSADFWRGKRVLLTGHTGFKGSWAATWLEYLGADVHGFSLAPDTSPSLWEEAGRPCEADGFGDIRNQATVAAAFERIQPEIVLHLAAQALVLPSYADPALTFDTNVMGLIRILDAARSCPSVRAIVNVTSDKCYENREQLWAYRETEAMGGSDPYSASKGCSELVTSSYRRSFFNTADGPQLASARAGNVIGGGDWSGNRLVPDCVRAFAAHESVLIRNPLATRPWQHVLEPVSGYLLLAEALFERGGEVAEGWNIGPSDEDAWPVQQIVEEMARTWGEGAAWECDPTVHAHEALLLRVDASKARARLGWRPRLRIAEALRWTVEWSKRHQSGENARNLLIDQIKHFETLPAA